MSSKHNPLIAFGPFLLGKGPKNSVLKPTITIKTHTCSYRMSYFDKKCKPQSPVIINGPKSRIQWNAIKPTFYKGFHLSFTINPDPYNLNFDVYNIKELRKATKKFLKEIIISGVERIILVFEHGKGKPHIHGMYRWTSPQNLYKAYSREKFAEITQQYFGAIEKHKQITLRQKLLRDVKYREKYIEYMQKEDHNKYTCGYIYSTNPSHYS